MKTYSKILSIAGSDSSGGAGIQGDIKTIAACGCYAMTAITAITVQNTLGVTGVHLVPAETISAQIHAVYDDPGVDAVKIGMLFSKEIVIAVTDALKQRHEEKLVVDPVMVSTSGARLIDDATLPYMIDMLFPIAAIITPNLPEAEVILGKSIKKAEELPDAARSISDITGRAILLKAGHLEEEEIVDVLYEPNAGFTYFKHERKNTKNTHGTGCALSSAIASYLGKGNSLKEAVSLAEQYIQDSIHAGSEYSCGAGNGPLHHFYKFWK